MQAWPKIDGITGLTDDYLDSRLISADSGTLYDFVNRLKIYHTLWPIGFTIGNKSQNTFW